jgi:hypothetical protein
MRIFLLLIASALCCPAALAQTQYAGRDLKLEREALAQRGKIEAMLPSWAGPKLDDAFKAFVSRSLREKTSDDLSALAKEELGRRFAGLSAQQTDVLTFYLLSGVIGLLPPHAAEGDKSPEKEGVEKMSEADMLTLQRMMEEKGRLETLISNQMKAGFEGGQAALQTLKAS